MMRQWLCALLLLLAATSPSWAASRAETRAFDAAAKAFRDGIWERADREFGEFLQKYPKADRRAEAILLQAQARCKTDDYAGAIRLLSVEQAAAGSRADEYLFWLGEAHYYSTNFPAAGEAYRAVVNNHPASKLRLEASVNEAAAWAGLKDWAKVESLLSEPAGAFQQLAKSAGGGGPVAEGILLLAEAQLTRQRFDAAEATLRQLEAVKLEPKLAWRREFLLCRALLGGGRAAPALESSSNLLALAHTLGQPVPRAQSIALHAAALEELGQLDSAAATYTSNLVADVQPDFQRQAALKIGELALVRGRLEEAANEVAKFLQRYSNSPACDVALLTLGELQLRLYVSPTRTNAPDTNLLQQALANLGALRVKYPGRPLHGKAELNRGWCFWQTTNLTESGAAFAAAAVSLPPSFDQAAARFKLADVQDRLSDFTSAISNYQAVVVLGEALPAVKTNLCEPALYQIVRASVACTNAPAADAAVARLLEWFPESHVTEISLLVDGQGKARQSNPTLARRTFEDLLKRFPNSTNAAQVRLAIGRTYELEGNWPGAAQEYRGWLTAFPTNAERPRAEFALALASYWANDETNALALLKNFIVQYPTNVLAPQAQWWVAAYHFRQNEFAEAEKDSQLLIRTWPGTPLAYEAGMLAGRAAMARQGWLDAIGYFTNLTSDLTCPWNLWTQAMFAYGDAQRRLDSSDTNNPLANFQEAIKIYARIHTFNPTNAQAARAWGEKGNCYFQLGAQNPHQYTNAIDAFRQVLDSPAADVAARCQASVALGLVAERLAELSTNNATALLTEARDRYLDVFYAKSNCVREGEQPPSYWRKEAGLKAARVLSDSLHKREAAEKIYEELARDYPPLQPFIANRLKKGS